ncbi:MAG: carotenoid 1,2-hydratase [Leptospira sp.]|nr:carotenoid 1,2-hydratase [Leptospira sp.]
MEWVYFVGNIKSNTGRMFGYELSFFRASRIEGDEIFPVHFAISDFKNKEHHTSETIGRTIGGLAGYAKKKIWSGDFSIQIIGKDKFHIKANPRSSIISLDLQLSGDFGKRLLINGDSGYSVKSRNNPSIYSYYYSFPGLNSKGKIKIRDSEFEITGGNSWMDHEWSGKIGSENYSSLSGNESSWDWVCLSFEDGSDLMAFNFREKRGSVSESSGTFRDSKGKIKLYKIAGELLIDPGDRVFRSTETGIKYPMEWKIRSKDLNLHILPVFDNQEFNGRKTTGQAYWEGSVIATGMIEGKKALGTGYLELKGYKPAKILNFN